MAERFLSLAFKFTVMFLGWLYLSGLTVIILLTIQNGASLLIRDSLMVFEVAMLTVILTSMGFIVLRYLKLLIEEYQRIVYEAFRPTGCEK